MFPRQEPSPRQPQYGYPQQQQTLPYNQPVSQPYQQQPYLAYQAPLPQHQTGYPAQRDGMYGGPNPQQQGGGQNISDLLANLRQMPQNQGPGSASGYVPPAAQTQDIGALLSNVARHQNPNHRPQATQYQQAPMGNPYDQRGPVPNYGGPSGGPSYGSSGGMAGAHQGPTQDVRNIMDQLAKWKQ